MIPGHTAGPRRGSCLSALAPGWKLRGLALWCRRMFRWKQQQQQQEAAGPARASPRLRVERKGAHRLVAVREIFKRATRALPSCVLPPVHCRRMFRSPWDALSLTYHTDHMTCAGGSCAR